jgi:SAM-dependent methyltransferase
MSDEAQALAARAIHRLKSRAEFPVLLEASVVGWDPLGADRAEVEPFLSDPQLGALLSGALVNDPDLELVLTHLRRCMLLGDADAVSLELRCALARQCFHIEYAYFAAEDEAAPLRELQARLAPILQAAKASSPALERLLVLAAAYAPLSQVPGWETMLQWPETSVSADFQPVWREQVIQHRREREIAARLEALTPIRDAVSLAVRSHYEDNPYPRWFSLPRPQPRTLAELAPGLRAPAGRGSVLIAGGGTGLHPIQTALSLPDCDVLAVDLSRASLAYAARKAEEIGVDNLRFGQADILELGALRGRFDLIESAGVLHHLADPLAGWRVLAALLQNGGVMRLSLYSELARRPLAATRDFIRDHGFAPSAEGIRLCRRAILDLPDGHPARSAMHSDDFYAASGFRDLVMHAHETLFSFPQIARCLEALDFVFLGLFLAPPEVMAAFGKMFPDPAAHTDLEAWDAFEQRNPEAFRGMYHVSCVRRD